MDTSPAFSVVSPTEVVDAEPDIEVEDDEDDELDVATPLPSESSSLAHTSAPASRANAIATISNTAWMILRSIYFAAPFAAIIAVFLAEPALEPNQKFRI